MDIFRTGGLLVVFFVMTVGSSLLGKTSPKGSKILWGPLKFSTKNYTPSPYFNRSKWDWKSLNAKLRAPLCGANSFFTIPSL